MKGKLVRSFSLQLFGQPVPLAAKGAVSFFPALWMFGVLQGCLPVGNFFEKSRQVPFGGSVACRN